MPHIILNKNNTSESTYSAYIKRKVARVVIVKKQKVLLIHSTKYNTYTLPGGGVEEGESLEQAAIREAREETGTEIVVTRELGTTTEVFDGRSILNISTAFSAQIKDEHNLMPDAESTEDGQELIWVPLAEAVDLIESVNKEMQHTAMLREVFFIQQYLGLSEV